MSLLEVDVDILEVEVRWEMDRRCATRSNRPELVDVRWSSPSEKNVGGWTRSKALLDSRRARLRMASAVCEDAVRVAMILMR